MALTGITPSIHNSRPPPPASPLSEPLLNVDEESEPPSDQQQEQQTHLIKGVAGLWWRQGLLLLQGVVELTLMGYALATDGDGTWVESIDL